MIYDPARLGRNGLSEPCYQGGLFHFTVPSLLLDEPPLQLLPQLAKMLGLNEAIVTQQLHFLLRQKDSGKELNGHRWIYNTYEEWRDKYFPFWSTRTIERVFAALEEMFLVESCQPDGRKSRRKYYRLNTGMVAKLTTENVPPGVVLDAETPDAANLAGSGRCRQFGGFDAANLAGSCARASKQTENPAEITEFDFDDDPSPALLFADWFKTLLPDGLRLTGTWRAAWADTYDKLVRIDKRTDADIRAVCLWARRDSFWARNFMSPAKLRQRNNDQILYYDVFTEAQKTHAAKNLPASVRAVNEGRHHGGPASVPTFRIGG